MTTLTPERPLMPAGAADAVMELLFPTPDPHLHDPDGFATERLGLESWSIPRRIRESVLQNRHTAVPACHESAKTHTAASIACWWEEVHGIGEAKIVSTAPTGDQVKALLWGDIRSMHNRAGLRGRITLDARWFIGDFLAGMGRKTADEPDPKKAMQAFQGVHARFPLVIIDEAGGVPKWLFDAADSIAANANGRVLAIGNPDDPTSHFAECCKAGSKWNVIPISAFDTPAFTGEDVSEQLLELLISPIYVDEMAALGTDSHIYQSKVLGKFPDVSDDALFPIRFIRRAQQVYRDGELDGLQRGGFGVDIARYGDAETCVYRNRGGVIDLVDSWSKQDTEETADRLDEILGRSRFRDLGAVIDAVGVGAGVFDKLRRRGRNVIPFGGGERAMRPERYPNRRTEILWELREAMEDGRVGLDPDDAQLEAQLGRIKWRPISGGRVEIETKEQMRKRGVKSPDRVDAVAMALAAPYASSETNTHLVDPPPSTLTSDLLERAI